MPSQEVLTALETLHREIEKLEPAIKHVEAAQQVTQTLKEIPQKNLELLTEVKNNDSKHKEELKTLFTKELSGISDENKKLQKTTAEIQKQVKQSVSAIQDKHVELFTELKNNDSQHKEDLKALFAKELSGLTDENKKLQKTTAEIQQQVKLEQEALGKLKETVQSFHERVEKINFPERLDKLDANIAGIMSSVQAIQGRLDIVERNITDRIRDMLDYQKETRTSLQNELVQTQTDMQAAFKKQKTHTYITWMLVLIVIIISVLVFYQSSNLFSSK